MCNAAELILFQKPNRYQLCEQTYNLQILNVCAEANGNSTVDQTDVYMQVAYTLLATLMLKIYCLFRVYINCDCGLRMLR